jgi:hypothetical protein
MSATLITWLKAVKTGYDSYKKYEKYSEAAKRAADGKKPYNQSKEVQKELKNLESLAKTLRDIASKGIGKPDIVLDTSDIFKMIPQLESSDKEAEAAALTFGKARLSSAEITDQGAELSTEIGKIAASAGARRDAAVKIRDQFEKLCETFPDPTGSSIKIMLFECYQAFEAASGALANVASAADDAVEKIDKEVEAERKKMQGLVKAFEEAYKTGENVRKSKGN